jgi:chloramphenicol 3-O phosphotransferase
MVIDCVLEWRSWLDEIVAALAGYQVYFVGVKCPLEELNRRERARGDRQIGFAQWQYNRVHTYGPYDLELDTHAHTPDECAEQLRKLLLSGPSPQAFPRLRAELKKSPA